jgi:uroporphyrinogen-III synthase
VSPTRPWRVLVTRPAAQAADWVERLRARGVAAEALPLIVIEAAADTDPLHAAWTTLSTRRLVVFVSANAVEHFFAARPAGVAWPAEVVAGAPGPGTAQALGAAGLAAATIVVPGADAPQFDSESLWRQLADRDWHDASVLVVAGDGGRAWLTERLRDAGATVETVRAYRRRAPSFAGADRERLDAALADPAAVWLFSSAEAIGHLEQAVGRGRFGGLRAVATHPRIAASARAAGFGRVVEAAPRLDAVVACIQSIGP